MKTLSIICIGALALGLVTGNAFGQAGYCKDYLENGNPGGTAGLKTFEEEGPYTPGSLFIDIWVCDLRPDPNEALGSAGFEIVYAPTITVVDVTMYTIAAGGPWSNASDIEDVPGENKIRVKLQQIGGVQPDGNNDVIMAKLEVQGTGTITFSPIPTFDTVVSILDGHVYDPEIIPNVFTVGGCTIDADCDDGLFCTGIESCNGILCETTGDPCTLPEVCDEELGACVAQCTVDGDCADDGVGCTDETCVAGTCVSTPNDANCPEDGTFCNGIEFCDAVNDCSSPGDPCPPQLCDDGLDACVDCLLDAECDDGIGCTDDTCNAGTCESTPNDANCPDDGAFCNGTEFCNAALDCSSTGNPCPGQSCNEGIDECVPIITTTTTSIGSITTTTITPPLPECETDEECDDDNPCTDDVCDSGSCINSPLDDGTECDDDLSCNGVETCVGGICQPGVNLCPDDGMYCNGTESCDEESDMCESSGNPCLQDQECNETEGICETLSGIEASTGAVGSAFLFLPAIVTIQGNTETDFTFFGSVVTYDSPLILKGLKLVNPTTQTINQIILLWPSIIFPTLSYPATVTVTVDGLSDEIEIGAFFF